MVAVHKGSVKELGASWDVPGVYFLFGPGENAESYTAYVGEASRRPLTLRLKEHVRGRAEWNRALLIARDAADGFHSAEVGWLEGRLHAVLTNAKAATVLNEKTPGDETLPEYARTTLERYVGPILAAMRALGYPPDTADQSPPRAIRTPRRYTESVRALMEAGLVRHRTRLVPTSNGIDSVAIVLSDGRLRVGGDAFDTPSGAARQVTGRATNGWEFWGVPSGEGGIKSLASLRAQLGPSGDVSADATGFPRGATRPPSAPTGEGSDSSSFTLNALYASGLLTSDDGIYAEFRGNRYDATFQADGQIRICDGRTFQSLSAAARAITGYSTNGWAFWRTLRDGEAVTLGALRDELQAPSASHVESAALSIEHVPRSDDSWQAIERFALAFDGAAHAGGGELGAGRALAAAEYWLQAWRRTGALPERLDELRLVLYAEQRRYRWTDMDGSDPANMDFIRAVVGAIRDTVSGS
jgi:hypothetical protein